jgi:hypothetical protein
MGRRQTEIYQSEAAYLKSVLFWLQGHWTGPAPTFLPLKELEQDSGDVFGRNARSGRNDGYASWDRTARL